MYYVAKQGKHMEAVEELGNIVELRKELLGSEHPDTRRWRPLFHSEGL